MVTTEGQLLTMSDYLRIYDGIETCTWHIEAPAGKFVKVNFTAHNLAPPEHERGVSG